MLYQMLVGIAAVHGAVAFSPASLPVRASVRVPRAAVHADAAEADVTAAAAAVRKAAKKFGKTQSDAANAWLDEALAGGSTSSASLMEQQILLFESCLLDDDDGGAKCKQLDSALVALQAAVDTKGGKAVSKKLTLSEMFAGNPVQEAAKKVTAAAGKFGPEQRTAASEYVKKALDGKAAAGGTELLEQQILLFGECLLNEDGTPSKCEDLEKALAGLQGVLGNKGDGPTPVASRSSAPSGAAAASNNGCYPYN